MASHRQLMTLFSKLKIDNDTRHDIVFRFTEGRTSSTKDLNAKEIYTLVVWLQDQIVETNKKDADFELALKRKRSLVLTLATRTGIKQSDSWVRFNGWMLKYSVMKKPLNQYNYDELDVLIRQFRGLEAHYKQSSEKTGTKAWTRANKFPLPSAN